MRATTPRHHEIDLSSPSTIMPSSPPPPSSPIRSPSAEISMHSDSTSQMGLTGKYEKLKAELGRITGGQSQAWAAPRSGPVSPRNSSPGNKAVSALAKSRVAAIVTRYESRDLCCLQSNSPNTASPAQSPQLSERGHDVTGGDRAAESADSADSPMRRARRNSAVAFETLRRKEKRSSRAKKDVIKSQPHYATPLARTRKLVRTPLSAYRVVTRAQSIPTLFIHPARRLACAF